MFVNNGGHLVLEVYLFVNPLGTRCLKSENSILKLADRVLGDVSYQFIPLLSPKVIDQHLRHLNQNEHDLNLRNQQFMTHYHVILDYKAALFQGKKLGRKFLLAVQSALVCQQLPYSDKLVTDIAKQVGLDLEMFSEDRRSALAQKAFQSDQKLAAEMGVDTPATAVLYNANISECGLLLNDVSYQALYEICDNHGLLANQAMTTQSKPNLHIL